MNFFDHRLLWWVATGGLLQVFEGEAGYGKTEGHCPKTDGDITNDLFLTEAPR